MGRPKVVSACVNFASSTDNGTCFPTGTGTSDLCYGNITGCFSLIMFSPYWTTVCDSSSVFFRHKETNDLYYYLKTVTSNFYVHVRTVFSLSLFASHANLQIVYGGVSSQSPNPNGISIITQLRTALLGKSVVLSLSVSKVSTLKIRPSTSCRTYMFVMWTNSIVI